MIRTTVRLPEGLVRQAKEKAIRERTTLTALIEQGLRDVVGRPLPPSRKRVTLPVSKAKGRQLVDIVKTSEVLEFLDEGLPLEKLR